MLELRVIVQVALYLYSQVLECTASITGWLVSEEMPLLRKYRCYPNFCMKEASIHTNGLSQDNSVLAEIWSGYLPSTDLERCRNVCCCFLCLVHFSFMWRRISVTTVWSKYVLAGVTFHEVVCKPAKHNPTVNRLVKPQNVINTGIKGAYLNTVV